MDALQGALVRFERSVNRVKARDVIIDTLGLADVDSNKPVRVYRHLAIECHSGMFALQKHVAQPTHSPNPQNSNGC
jgi:hypothetical protein